MDEISHCKSRRFFFSQILHSWAHFPWSKRISSIIIIHWTAVLCPLKTIVSAKPNVSKQRTKIALYILRSCCIWEITNRSFPLLSSSLYSKHCFCDWSECMRSTRDLGEENQTKKSMQKGTKHYMNGS